jgi:hypothetical protein
MTSRFLSFVALSGMLIAAGCSGGGAGSGSGLSSGVTPAAPSTGGSSTGSSTSTTANKGSFSISFQVPAADVTASTASSAHSRNADYVSPGSTGLQIILSKDGVTTPTFAVGTATAPLQLQPTPAGGITANTTAGAYGTNTTGTVGQTGTAQLSGNIAAGAAAAAVINVNTIPGSTTVTPVVGQSFTITNTDAPAAGVLSLTVKTVSGTPSTGLLMTATVVTDTPGTNAVGWTTGDIINFGSSSNLQSTYTYTFTPGGTGAGAQATGYYTATITFNNMTGSAAGTPYVAGVVLTDTANSNYVLSEGQTAPFNVGAFGPTTVQTLTLKPVVAGVYIPTPTALANGSLESTIFVTDEKGFVIPNQTANIGLSDNNASLTVAPSTAGGLTLSDYFNAAGYGTDPVTTTSITTAPVIAASAAEASLTVATGVASATAYGNLFGTFFTNYIQPTSPFTLLLNGATTQVATNANGVGNPVNITCASAGLQGLKITLTSTTPATVGGYTYTAGTNVPATGGVTLTSGTLGSQFPGAGSIDCNPSIVLPIQ